jgi:flagellar hook-length control protein FliK
MSDMGLPGIGLAGESKPAQGGGTAPRDPAQAFDAVMARYSGAPRNTPARPADRQDKDEAPAQADAPQAPGAKPVARAGAQEEAATQPQEAAATIADVASLVTTAVQAAPPGAAPAAGEVVGVDSNEADATPPAGTPAQSLRPEFGTAGAVQKAPAAEGSAPTELLPAAEARSHAAEPVATSPVRRAPAAARDTLADAAAKAPPAGEATTRETTPSPALAPARAGIESAAAATAAHATATAAHPPVLPAPLAGPGAPATYSIAHAAVTAPLGSGQFASDFAQRVVLFAGQSVQHAEISVSPAELGPIAVAIEMRGQEATLAFAASNHATRAAIEDALPRLREMLAAQGLHLAGAHVGDQPRRESARHGHDAGTRSERGARAVAAELPVAGVRRGRGLIDIVV